jgi:hypothetical protein
MTPTPLARYANVTHDAANPAAANQNAFTLRPYLVQLRQEMLVVVEVAHLILVARRILL